MYFHRRVPVAQVCHYNLTLVYLLNVFHAFMNSLYGCTCAQTFYYYYHYPHDGKFTKFIV